MTPLLDNHLGGRWQTGSGAGTPLFDPVLGTELVRISSVGLDLAEGFDYARQRGGAALRALTYGERAALLARVAETLQSQRDAWFDIALQNSGTTRNDSAVDIDGAIFTLGQYARWGAKLGDARWLTDGAAARLGKDGSFQSGHVLTPQRGLVLGINAFNFPAWGLWEKAAPALLSGVPVVVKPASATAWLTQRMVADVVAAGVLPDGALSVVCGSSDGLLDALQPFDLLSFTGSADTARAIREHAAVLRHGVRMNSETDSLNSALLGPDATPGSDAFASAVREIVREMTIKSGQKCTAIRRVLVPQEQAREAADAIASALAAVKVGNPRNESVRMGSLASRAQANAVREGIGALAGEAKRVYAGDEAALVDADASVGAFAMPHLFAVDDADASSLVHEVEVFGPVATVVPYRDAGHAFALARRGAGSLVASVFTADEDFAERAAIEIGHAHGRVHVVTPAVAKTHTGHGNVMPMSLHGGPGRAGGGEELGGLRALAFYHQRSAIQGPQSLVESILGKAAAFPDA
ncbi:MAG: 3,4-dehydroadipyl-CoA semialdehyde dehydrogenase [Burkholderiaceae bacterium]|nr:3,4-dehydroadipyl-CoA semialdehyde dehydrogenase [Burkholderiaceae bacterium]